MSESAVGQLKDVPTDIKRKPISALGIGLVALVVVLIIETYNPGAITGPIKKLLAKVGIGTGA